MNLQKADDVDAFWYVMHSRLLTLNFQVKFLLGLCLPWSYGTFYGYGVKLAGRVVNFNYTKFIDVVELVKK